MEQRTRWWKSFAPGIAFHSTTSHQCQVPFLHLSGTTKRIGQDSEERRLGAGKSSGSGLLQQVVFGSEDDGGVASHDRLVESEWVLHSHQILHGDSIISPGVDQEGDIMFSINLKDAYFQIPIHLDSQPYLRITFEE